MKKLLVLCLIFAGFSANAHKFNVPDAVRLAFGRQFPAVNAPKWELEKGNYEATFRLDGQKTSAVYDKEGKCLETEREIAVSALPGDAVKYVEANFNGKIPRAASIIKLGNGDINYEAHISGRDLVFDANGKFLRTEKD